MIRNTIVLIGLLGLMPLQLSAQRPESASDRIEAARARAAGAGIPSELLENRIAEGRAKGIAEERIAQAIERREAGLARAQAAFVRAEQRPTASELSAGADAIEAGVDNEALHAVIQAARAEDRPVALAVLGELVAQGMPVQNALDRVTAALERRGQALGNLPHEAAAERAGRGGGRPATPGAAGQGRPDGVGGGRPDGVGRPAPVGPGGPPAAVPSPGQRPEGAGPPAERPGRPR